MKILNFLNESVLKAMVAAGLPEDSQPLLTYAKNLDFGDYQANGIMAAAKKLKQNPRELAEQVLAKLELEGVVEKAEIAGPGFINITLESGWLAGELKKAAGSAQQLLEHSAQGETVVVDYSGPNLAKEMHVGHLRSTIIGDAVARVLELSGDKVVRQNHLGDWGTQFGMLITLLADEGVQDAQHLLSDLESFYRDAKKRFDEDEDFAKRSRQNVVSLQSGDELCLKLWKVFTEQSFSHCFNVYQRLGVSLDQSHTRAESAYNDVLASLVEQLDEQGLLKEDQGAKCVFLEGFESKDGTPLPVIVQKSDGGFLYATTDLAALQYRASELDADRILYFVDIRQSLHFRQVFTLAKKAGLVDDDVKLEHMPFGTMLGEDKKPFKTRSGDLIKLEDLLDEAESRAFDIVSEKQAGLDENKRKEIAHQVGIGAVKYADLSKNRTSDYVFSWESMLSFEGNTAPYLQYAYARIQSIFRKYQSQGNSIETLAVKDINLADPAERRLVLKILQLNDVLESVAQSGFPHYLCEYLFELTQMFMAFYEQCPVLNAQENSLRDNRLYLCQMTASTLKLGLDVLGIETPDSM